MGAAEATKSVIPMETCSQDCATCEGKDVVACHLAVFDQRSCNPAGDVTHDWCIVSYDRRGGKSHTATRRSTSSRDAAVQCDTSGPHATAELSASALRVRPVAAPQSLQFAHEEGVAKVDLMGEYVLTDPTDP